MYLTSKLVSTINLTTVLMQFYSETNNIFKLFFSMARLYTVKPVYSNLCNFNALFFYVYIQLLAAIYNIIIKSCYIIVYIYRLSYYIPVTANYGIQQ